MPLRNIGGAALVCPAIDSALLCIRDWGIVECGQHPQQMPVFEVFIASPPPSVHVNLASVKRTSIREREALRITER